MTDDEILESARAFFDGMPGNLIVTGSDPKHPEDVKGLVGLAYVTPDWMRSIGLGRRNRISAREVAYAARDLRRQADKRALQGRRRYA